MPVLLAGSTMKSPPHSPVFTPKSGASAARRCEPGVWAVAVSNCEGDTIRTGGYLLMIVRSAPNLRVGRSNPGLVDRAAPALIHRWPGKKNDACAGLS